MDDDVVDAEVVDEAQPELSEPPDDPPAVKLARSLLFALMTANEREDGSPQPYPIPMPAIVKVAEMLIGHVWEQSGEVTDAKLPSWLIERSREDAQPTPVQPDMSVVADSPRVCSAPKPPKNLDDAVVVG